MMMKLTIKKLTFKITVKIQGVKLANLIDAAANRVYEQVALNRGAAEP